MTLLFDLLIRAIPASAVIGLTFWFVPKSLTLLRVILLIFLFIVFRDAMTPVGIWTITSDLQLRFVNDNLALISLALFSFVGALGSSWLLPELKKHFIYFKKPAVMCVVAGILGAVLVAALPLTFQARSLAPLPALAAEALPALFLLAVLGNFMEEVLFRVYFQGYLSEHVSANRAALLSGLMFSVCHVFLAFTVTSAGPLLLVFTLYEGLICAFLMLRFGLVAATLAHGLGIFVVCGGLSGRGL
jgi:membrane protease YdiL (CAAX protease family)